MIVCKHKDNRYLVSIKKINHIKNNIETDTDFIAKFDSGASVSYMTLKSLSKFNEDDASRIKIVMENSNKFEVLRNLESASNHKFDAIMCQLKNIKIGDFEFSNFYIAVNPTLSYNKVLLGDNFIKCCKFNHDINGDIIVIDFDYDLYESSHKFEKEIFDLDNIDFVSEEKVIAASFRKYFNNN